MRQFVLCLMLASAVVCLASDKVYQKGKYLDVSSESFQKLISNSYTGSSMTVTRHENDLSVQIDGIIYVGECEEKVHFSSCRPGTWIVGDMIDVRIDNDKMFLRKPNGGEVKTRIVKRVRVAESAAP